MVLVTAVLFGEGVCGIVAWVELSIFDGPGVLLDVACAVGILVPVCVNAAVPW